MRHFSVVLLTPVLLLGVPSAVAAQFQIPLTPPMPGDSVCAIKASGGDPCEARWDTAEVREIRDSVRRLTLQPEDTVPPIARAKLGDRGQVTFSRWGIRTPTVFRGDDELRKLYQDSGLQWFNQFQATLTDERIYLNTSLLSGLIGRFLFDLSVANAVSSEEEAGPGLTEEEVREGTTNLLRLVNNGGSGVARLLMPIRVGGGTNHQMATGAYVNAGAIGPLSNVDSLALTVGAVLEGLFTSSIRNATSYELEGEIVMGLRLGYQWVGDGGYINPTTEEDELPFLQVAVGIRKEGETRLSLLYTLVEKAYREFTPELQLSVNTSGF